MCTHSLDLVCKSSFALQLWRKSTSQGSPVLRSSEQRKGHMRFIDPLVQEGHLSEWGAPSEIPVHLEEHACASHGAPTLLILILL